MVPAFPCRDRSLLEGTPMPRKQQYSIGELSQLCNVSKKALRFYDKIGLISSLRHDYNNYRMYTHDELLLVPVLKYYKQMGFKLDEMRRFISGRHGNVYSALRAAFEQKLEELHKAQIELKRCEESVRDWQNLIREAELVITENVREPAVKYVEKAHLLFQEQPFDGDIKSAIINLDFMNYVEKTSNAITGPVYIHFSSTQDRIEGKPQNMRIMQQVLEPCGSGGRVDFGGCMMASCYHIGSPENIHETYRTFLNWIHRHGYSMNDDCYERYVSDYWTTSNSDCHVTELLIKVSRNQQELRDI